MHPSELGDRLVVGLQTSQQPHHFHVALALGLQPPRRPHLPQIPVQVQLQQITRIVARSSVSAGSARTKPSFAMFNRPTNASMTRHMWSTGISSSKVAGNIVVCSRASPRIYAIKKCRRSHEDISSFPISAAQCFVTDWNWPPIFVFQIRYDA